MKTVLVFLLVLELALLHLQVDARRLVLVEVKTKRNENQFVSNARPNRKLDAVNTAGNDINANNQPGKASTYANPLTGSVPAVDANNDNNKPTSTSTNNKGTSSDDETNNSYGTYGNPSGSTTDTHHVYTNACQPGKTC